jgi:hypothetical protein
VEYFGRIVSARMLDSCGNCGNEIGCTRPDLELGLREYDWKKGEWTIELHRIEADRDGRYQLKDDGGWFIVDVDFATAQMLAMVYAPVVTYRVTTT